MSTQCLVIKYAVAVFALIVVFSACAQAGATRTFVSTSGNDANTSASCAPSAPCRTFAAAISVTNAGGEIVVLTSGGYGPATITQPVIITAIGVDASISVSTSGANGLTINTPGNVTIRGVSLHGEGTGRYGILVQQVGFLRLYNMLIENFLTHGIDLEVSGNLSIYDSAINSNATDGIHVGNTSANVLVNGVSLNNNGNGVDVIAGRVIVANSSVEYTDNIAFSSVGNLTLFNDRVVFNGVALSTDGLGATLYFAHCLIANNAVAYGAGGDTAMAGTSPGTSLIGPGQISSGMLGTAIALQ